MKVLVAGGSGFIGRALCARLGALGHEAVILTRRPAAAAPGQVRWDGAGMAPEWLRAAGDCSAWINLCGEGIADSRWSRARRTVLRESRLAPTRALVAGLEKVGAKPAVLINASAVGCYGETGDQAVDESAPYGEGFLAELCRDWELEALKAAALGVRTVCLRLGVVLGAGGGMLSRLVPLFRLGLGGPLGDGRQWLSWISREDFAGLVAHLLAADVSGAVNAVSPKPVTNEEFCRTLGRVLGRPAALRVPSFALRLAFGQMADALLLGQRASPRKALDSGYAFRQPDLEAVLRAELS
ncbi:MAG: TIGR01777 family oxidoreductase [Elusimicrobia bacterium]|nr:TIGR01777 family oxidoreductase [Elusimicrobiota bacterium]